MSETFIGEIRMFAGNFAPRGWSFCDGELVAVSQNDALFSLFGTIYGGDGRTTFALPDLRGRIPVHMGTGAGLSSRPLGQKIGTEEVSLIVNEIPSHAHDVYAGNDSATSRTLAGKVLARGVDATDKFYVDSGADTVKRNLISGTVANTGGGQPHFNLMSTQCVNFIVALSGTYPNRH